MKKNKIIHWSIISIFLLLYILTSVISTIHSIDFFNISNNLAMSITLAIAFEIGAAASLASIIVLDKMNKYLIWGLFIILTAFQIMNNVYYAFAHLIEYKDWIELFSLQDQDPIFQKRILAIVSGAILPIVALGFIKSLVDYIRPDVHDDANNIKEVTYTTDDSLLDKPESKTLNEDSIIPQKSSNEIKDPKLRQAADEYINKTKTDYSHNIKTIPGIA